MNSPFDIIPGGAVAPPASPATPDWWSSIFGLGQNQQQNQQQNPVAPNTGSTVNPNTNANTPLSGNVGTLQAGVGGLTALGNLWSAWNATNLAKQSFNFNKSLSSDNYTNSADAYNTNLQNIASTRGVMENQTPGQVQNYIAGHSVKTTV